MENQGYVDINNSTTTNLTTATNSRTYEGVWFDCTNYSELTCLINSDQWGTLYMDISMDSLVTDRTKSIVMDRVSTAHTLVVISKYMRIRFIADVDTTTFRMQTMFHKYKSKELTSTINQVIDEHDDVQNTRSIIVAQKTDNTYQNVKADYNGDLKVSLGAANQTAFGEIKVANLTPVIEELFSYNINLRKFNTTIVGSATATQANSMAVVGTGTTTGSSIIMSTNKKIRYRAGLGMLSRFTAIFTSPVTGTFQMIGFGEDDDGFGFMYAPDNTFNVVHRNSASGSVVDILYEQSTWSSDKADGTGSLPVMDWTKGNVFEIQFQYLGFGAIKFLVENPSTGEFILVHTIAYANAHTQPSMAIPILPLSILVDNGATTSDIVVKTASMAAFIEGEDIVLGVGNSINNSKSGIGSTDTNIITLRNRTTYHSLENHNIIYPKLLNIATIGGTKPTIIKLTINAVLGGTPSWTNVDTLTSIGEYDIAGTTITNGNVVTSTVLGKEDRITIDLDNLGLFISPGESITISASTSSGNVEVYTTMTSIDDI